MRICPPTLAAILAAAILASPAMARQLDPANPEDALAIMRRTQCGVKDNVPAVYRWQGKVYSRRQGEPDKHLFNMEGMNIRQCVTVTDTQLAKPLYRQDRGGDAHRQ